MKSVLLKVFACSVLMLANVAANAAVDYSTQVYVIAHTNFSHSQLVVVASADDDQADSSEAETMLA
jgi:hypothetical protein